MEQYEQSLVRLSEEAISLDAKERELLVVMDRFDLKTIEIIGLVNAYDSVCQLENQKPN